MHYGESPDRKYFPFPDTPESATGGHGARAEMSIVCGSQYGGYMSLAESQAAEKQAAEKQAAEKRAADKQAADKRAADERGAAGAAPAPEPVTNASPPTRLPANHLMDTVLPVRPALI
ncbi:MAG: hypothetical protein ACXVYB_19145, partial [Arthrobacter sp.]